MNLTDQEYAWLKAADKLFKRKPSSLNLYTCDGDIIVCKKGESASDFAYSISNSDINACNVIVDVHDDFDFGRG